MKRNLAINDITPSEYNLICIDISLNDLNSVRIDSVISNNKGSGKST